MIRSHVLCLPEYQNMLREKENGLLVPISDHNNRSQDTGEIVKDGGCHFGYR